jgi:uncharacterized protein with HEPN domain
MERDPRVYLWDIREATAEISGFIEGLDRAGYDASALVRAAVERKFEIIGEAMPTSPGSTRRSPPASPISAR